MIIDDLVNKLQEQTRKSMHHCKGDVEHEINVILEDHPELVREIEEVLGIDDEQ